MVLVGFHYNLLLKYENGFTRSLEVAYPLPEYIFLLSYSIFAGCYMYCTYLYLYMYIYTQTRLFWSMPSQICGEMRGIWASLSCFT